jgi:hypothetical protein
MIRTIGRVAAAMALALVLTGGSASAQKVGGVLRVHLWDGPPNLSVLEGVNPLAARTLMPVPIRLGQENGPGTGPAPPGMGRPALQLASRLRGSQLSCAQS